MIHHMLCYKRCWSWNVTMMYSLLWWSACYLCRNNRFIKSMQLLSYNYCISGIIRERKLSQYVNCHSVREKTLMNLVIRLVIWWFGYVLFFLKWNNVCKCTKIHEIYEHFLLQMIANIWYLWMAYIARHILYSFIRIKILLYKFVIINEMLKWKMQLYSVQHIYVSLCLLAISNKNENWRTNPLFSVP